MPKLEPDKDEKAVRVLWQDGVPVPDQDPIKLKKDNGKVKWYANFDFRISVDGYSDLTYSQAGGEFMVKSGKFNTARQHKYTISANGIDNDPILDIEP
jgi:hypothetical protein